MSLPGVRITRFECFRRIHICSWSFWFNCIWETMSVHHKIRSKWYFCKRYIVFISVCDKAAKLPSVEKLIFSLSLVTLELVNIFFCFNKVMQASYCTKTMKIFLKIRNMDVYYIQGEFRVLFTKFKGCVQIDTLTIDR